jgi:predicted Holliday junction resolvase-like endonuclease
MELLIIALAIVATAIITYITNKSKQKEINTLQKQLESLRVDLSLAVSDCATVSAERDRYASEAHEMSLNLAEVEVRARDEARRLLETWKNSEEAVIRADAIKRSKRVTKGNSIEQLAPYLVDIGHPSDIRFLGSPVDFICFKNAAAIRNGDEDQIEKILLVDIKTGQSKLSKVQRRIRDAVAEGRIEFMTVTLETDNV